MRVATAFNKMLGLVGASVASVAFTPEGVVVGLRRRRAMHRCPCGWKTWSTYDRSVRRWRHLDLGATRCFLEAEIVRIDCKHCGRVRTEEVPWARPRARHSRDLQDVVAWLAQRTDKTTITKLLRISWEAVAKIVIDVVAEAIDDTRLENLYRIGVDEVSYRKGHRYLSVVADHDREGAVVWVGEGKDHGVLEAFYDELGDERLGRLECISLDMGGAYKLATDTKAPHLTQCVDPFHLVKLANEGLPRLWLSPNLTSTYSQEGCAPCPKPFPPSSTLTSSPWPVNGKHRSARWPRTSESQRPPCTPGSRRPTSKRVSAPV